jgi:DNA-binding transcriptional ArsR family regulator
MRRSVRRAPFGSAARGIAGAASAFAALGDATRLAIVARLCDAGPASIASLTDVATVSRQAVTKHLRTLEAVGLVESRRRGRARLWTLRRKRLAEVRGYLETISREWDAALGRLRSYVERSES